MKDPYYKNIIKKCFYITRVTQPKLELSSMVHETIVLPAKLLGQNHFLSCDFLYNLLLML